MGSWSRRDLEKKDMGHGFQAFQKLALWSGDPFGVDVGFIAVSLTRTLQRGGVWVVTGRAPS